MDLFLVDNEKNDIISWEKLISDINESTIYNKYCKSDSYYSVFRNIIISMLFEKEIVLLDSDFTDFELIKLIGFSDYNSFDEVLDKRDFKTIVSKGDLVDQLRMTNDKWRVTLFTSGTSGIPKKVSHNFQSISRFVKIYESTNSSIWGFAYNPTHMAGVQVFLQALLNGNQVVRVFGLSKNVILEEIVNNKVSCISATPTFYKLLLPCEVKFESVKRITSGGEKFNEEIKRELLLIFPNAKFNNVYASTETGTLFASSDDLFSVKNDFEALVKIVNGELYIHSSLMGDNEIVMGEWYNTEDLVDVVTEKPLSFRFISRNSDMINVGGYKVNPLEVEEVLLTFDGIINARVFAKNNSVLGKIICCEIILENKSIEEKDIRAFLQSKLQEFKVPRIYKFVDVLDTTRTGKIKRN